MKRRILIWSLVTICLGATVWGMVNLASSANNQGETILATAISSSDWVKGDRNAKVVLIEYSDFECPACASYAPIVDRVVSELGNKIAFVYRNFPLPQHQNAYPAAHAAEAAGKQGKFWEMATLLFANQTSWENQSGTEPTFETYANSLNLNLDKFKADFSSKEVADKVQNDYLSGVASVTYTPTFFLNGEKIQPAGYDDFHKLILQKINQNP